MSWDFIGNEWAVQMLREHSAEGKVRHAYLFTGPQGAGRRTLALKLAQAVNCTQPPSPGVPCGVCQACVRIARMQHPDLAVVEAEQEGGNLKVEQVRDLQHGLALAPYEANYRIALLMRFEEANVNAQNALLKTLEEPNPQVVLLLTAASAENLLPTIASRCEIVRLSPLPVPLLEKTLQDRWNIPPEKARLLSHISDGRPGLALRYHEDENLLAARRQALDEHRRLLAGTRAERFAFAGKEADRRRQPDAKEKLYKLLVIWLSYWRDIMLRAASASTPITNLDRQEEIEKIASGVGLLRAKQAVQSIERALDTLGTNANLRLMLEVMFLDLPRIP